MNLRHFLIVLGLALSPAVMAAGRDAWTHRQTVELTQPGLTRIELDPALLDASRAAVAARRARLPKPEFQPDLPVNERRADIAELIGVSTIRVRQYVAKGLKLCCQNLVRE